MTRRIGKRIGLGLNDAPRRPTAIDVAHDDASDERAR
jgi:hypothetical protein